MRQIKGAVAAGVALTMFSVMSVIVAAQAQDGFVPASSLPQTPAVSAPALVLGAYALVWLFVVAFVWSLWRRMGRIEHDLVEAKRILDARRP